MDMVDIEVEMVARGNGCAGWLSSLQPRAPVPLFLCRRVTAGDSLSWRPAFNLAAPPQQVSRVRGSPNRCVGQAPPHPVMQDENPDGPPPGITQQQEIRVGRW